MPRTKGSKQYGKEEVIKLLSIVQQCHPLRRKDWERVVTVKYNRWADKNSCEARDWESLRKKFTTLSNVKISSAEDRSQGSQGGQGGVAAPGRCSSEIRLAQKIRKELAERTKKRPRTEMGFDDEDEDEDGSAGDEKDQSLKSGSEVSGAATPAKNGGEPATGRVREDIHARQPPHQPPHHIRSPSSSVDKSKEMAAVAPGEDDSSGRSRRVVPALRRPTREVSSTSSRPQTKQHSKSSQPRAGAGRRALDPLPPPPPAVTPARRCGVQSTLSADRPSLPLREPYVDPGGEGLKLGGGMGNGGLPSSPGILTNSDSVLLKGWLNLMRESTHRESSADITLLVSIQSQLAALQNQVGTLEATVNHMNTILLSNRSMLPPTGPSDAVPRTNP